MSTAVRCLGSHGRRDGVRLLACRGWPMATPATAWRPQRKPRCVRGVAILGPPPHNPQECLYLTLPHTTRRSVCT
eukprot:364378-Chlamydomonas_euryale.AAC.7